jgi:tetratricopeptide (TPR) repeat protein
MTQRERLESGRIRPPYAESVEGEELDVLPRPVPKAFGRAVIAATAITLLIGAFVIHAKSNSDPVKEPAPPSSAALRSAPIAVPVAAPPSTSASVPSAPAPVPSSDPSPSVDAPAASSAEAASAPAAPSAKDLITQAQTLLNRQSFGHAAEVARRATQADPTNAEGWLMLGGAYEALGSKEKARSAYRKCADQAKGSGARECRALLAQ